MGNQHCHKVQTLKYLLLRQSKLDSRHWKNPFGVMIGQLWQSSLRWIHIRCLPTWRILEGCSVPPIVPLSKRLLPQSTEQRLDITCIHVLFSMSNQIFTLLPTFYLITDSISSLYRTTRISFQSLQLSGSVDELTSGSVMTMSSESEEYCRSSSARRRCLKKEKKKINFR